MSELVETTSDNGPFWQGYAQAEVRLPFCRECGRAHLPPGPFCPFCLGENLVWHPSSGAAVLSSWVTVRQKHFKDFETPYVVAEVQLEEGPRITTLIDSQDCSGLHMGRTGRIKFGIAPNGLKLPYFAPDI